MGMMKCGFPLSSFISLFPNGTRCEVPLNQSLCRLLNMLAFPMKSSAPQEYANVSNGFPPTIHNRFSFLKSNGQDNATLGQRPTLGL